MAHSQPMYQNLSPVAAERGEYVSPYWPEAKYLKHTNKICTDSMEFGHSAADSEKHLIYSVVVLTFGFFIPIPWLLNIMYVTHETLPLPTRSRELYFYIMMADSYCCYCYGV
jgi:hypothetical protein